MVETLDTEETGKLAWIRRQRECIAYVVRWGCVRGRKNFTICLFVFTFCFTPMNDLNILLQFIYDVRL